MKFIVTLTTELVEAETHEEALNKIIKQLWEAGYTLASVCDMDIGNRQHFKVKFENADRRP